MSETENLELPVSESFLLGLFAGFAACVAGILSCALKSRCTKIKLCCFECDREVLKGDDLKNIKIDTGTNT
jgi:hypothetical protein